MTTGDADAESSSWHGGSWSAGCWLPVPTPLVVGGEVGWSPGWSGDLVGVDPGWRVELGVSVGADVDVPAVVVHDSMVVAAEQDQVAQQRNVIPTSSLMSARRLLAPGGSQKVMS